MGLKRLDACQSQKGVVMARKEAARDGVADMRQQLRSGLPAACILLFGDEVFLVERFLDEIRQTVLQPDTRAFNEIILEGRVRPQDVTDACETYPVFAPRKLVIVRKSGFFKTAARKRSTSAEEGEPPAQEEGSADSAEGETADAESVETAADSTRKHDWKPFFESLPSHTLLVFVEESVNKTVGLYKLVEKHGLAARMDYQKPDVLQKWVMKGFSVSGKRISPREAEFLTHQAEDGMTTLHQEIGKIALFMGERTEVNREDILAVVNPSIRSRVFDLMDAVAGSDRARALVMLDEMIQKREAEQKIFYMIARQAGRLLQLRNMGPGLSSDAKAARLDMNAYALSKMERLAGRMSRQTLVRFVQTCAEMDLAVKNGRIRMRLALELLIAGLEAS